MEGLKGVSESIDAQGRRQLLTEGGTGVAAIKDGSQPAPRRERFDHDLVHLLRLEHVR